MPRKRLLIGATAIFLAITATIISGLLYAQDSDFISDFLEIVQIKPGDDTVVATINGLNFTHREVRLGTDLITLVDPSITQDEAVRQSILQRIDEFVIQSEVERRGLVPTMAEARKLMEAQREPCMGPHGAECRETIKAAGFDLDDFWEDGIPTYRKDLGKMRLMEVLHREWQEKVDDGLIPAGDDEHTITLKILDDLRNEAQILWADDRLESLFDEAQTARTNELFPPPADPVSPGDPDDTTGPVGNINE